MKSILFSLLQHFWHLSLFDALTDTFSAIRGIARALRPHSGDQKIISALRTLHCEKCEFYDAKWKTCGTPGETMGEPLTAPIKIGCWCYLPLANKDPKKDCWARFHDLRNDDGPVGWPDVLRPDH